MKKRLSLAVLFVLLVFVAVSIASADGTETLGPPSTAISSGTGIAVGGVGLCDQCTPAGANPGTLSVNVPAGATVNQVLLYWHGAMLDNAAPPDTVNVGGTSITGALIGGPTNFFLNVWDSTFRADITTLGLVGAGTSTFNVGPLGYDQANLGAGVVVIYNDGSDPAFIDLRDGQDLAWAGFSGALQVTVPQTFNFAADTSDRIAELGILSGSAQPGTTNTIRVTTGGVTTDIPNALQDTAGPQFDAVTVQVNIPAGADSLTVELISGPGVNPSSISWLVGALSVPPPPEGDGCTPGYWRQPHHLDSWVPTGLNPGDDFDTTFGVDYFDPEITLLDATWAKGGGVNKVARHGTAALLNALHPAVDYPVSAADVIAAVQAGDVGDLADYNELSSTCPAENY